MKDESLIEAVGKKLAEDFVYYDAVCAVACPDIHWIRRCYAKELLEWFESKKKEFAEKQRNEEA